MTSSLLADPPLIPPAPAPATRRILFATDFSPASEHALQRAIETARKEGAELIVAHVYESPSGWGVEGTVDPEIDKKMSAIAQKQLDAIVALATTMGVTARGVLHPGKAAKELIDLARENGVELLVMGTHGRTGLKKLFMGSVASDLVATAPCPVLTVH